MASNSRTSSRKYLLGFALICFFGFRVLSQEKGVPAYPKIGDQLPEMVFDELVNSSKSSISTNDFRGKFLILDFWGVGCASCIESFPFVNRMQEKYKDRLQYLLVGQDYVSETINIRSLYKKQADKHTLNLPSAIVKKAVFEKMGVFSVPHLIFIDEKGIIKHISSSVKEPEIIDFMNGNKMTTMEKKDGQVPYDFRKSYAENKYSDTGLVFQSTLRPFIRELRYTDWYEKNRITLNTSLLGLYSALYNNEDGSSPIRTNGWAQRIVIDVKDKGRFDDSKFENNIFYELIVPDELAKQKRKIMSEELRRILPYETSIEKRKTKVQFLISTDTLKIKSKGENMTSMISLEKGVDLSNVPIHDLVTLLQKIGRFNLFNGTGYEGNVDIKIPAPWLTSSRDEVIKILKKYGLYILDGEMELDHLVIRDKKPSAESK